MHTVVVACVATRDACLCGTNGVVKKASCRGGYERPLARCLLQRRPTRHQTPTQQALPGTILAGRLHDAAEEVQQCQEVGIQHKSLYIEHNVPEM